MQNPFAKSPTDEQVSRDLHLPQHLIQKPGKNIEMQRRSETLTDIRNPARELSVADDNCLFLPILLTDSGSLYTAILRIQPRSEDRCAKIILNYLRDLQSLLRISYIDAPANLADVETKHAGSLDILAKFLISGMFTLSFVGRRKIGEMKMSVQTAKADHKKSQNE